MLDLYHHGCLRFAKDVIVVGELLSDWTYAKTYLLPAMNISRKRLLNEKSLDVESRREDPHAYCTKRLQRHLAGSQRLLVPVGMSFQFAFVAHRATNLKRDA